ncbi:hypothetical protein ACERK3_11795 [Phycisphaerales bacterium AB-hyl4]|uniref:Zinc ribbon domain-containing protein n=1 Tax=Natronomicrosphaera hydrolytica TaxID=3242702 RepID=A0ABV4U7K5_9BACT
MNARRYCRSCSYPLVTGNSCPECGRVFDPADHRTWRRRPRSDWHRFVLRLGFVICLLAAFGLLGRERLTAMAHQGEHLRIQRQAANNVLPPGTVIYTEDASHIATVRGDPAYRPDPFRPEIKPERWHRIGRDFGIELRDQVRSRIDRYAVGGVFGAERTSANGHTWIVTVAGGNIFPSDSGTRLVHLAWRNFEPVGWASGARGSGVSRMGPKIELTPADRLTLFAPETDPSRADRVIVPYELNGQNGRLAMTLRDGGSLAFEVLDGPATLAP